MARRTANELASDFRFSATDAGRLALVVTEAAKNLAAHAAGGGELVVQMHTCESHTWAEVYALDKGPGMENVDRCLRDGYSTAGTPGTGLGAIQRVSDVLDIYSVPGSGTVLYARVCCGREAGCHTLPHAAIGSLSVPITGETLNGDTWSFAERPGFWTFMVVDGLGHGPIAEEAAREASAEFEHVRHKTPEEIIGRMHEALRHTRGAAVLAVQIGIETHTAACCGIGNISGKILTEDASKSMISQNGTAGLNARKIQQYQYEAPSGGLLVLHTDGIATHWDLARYPGLASRAPAIIAGLLYRDFARGRDDATVLVARIP